VDERLNRLGVLVLSVLEGEEADTPYTGLTIKDMKGKLQEIPEQTITFYKTTRKLCDNGYASIGIKDGKSYTYYITEQGQKLLIKIKNGE